MRQSTDQVAESAQDGPQGACREAKKQAEGEVTMLLLLLVVESHREYREESF
jgi:hypothetical protein